MEPLFGWTTAFLRVNISDNFVNLIFAIKKKKAKGSMNFFQWLVRVGGHYILESLILRRSRSRKCYSCSFLKAIRGQEQNGSFCSTPQLEENMSFGSQLPS